MLAIVLTVCASVVVSRAAYRFARGVREGFLDAAAPSDRTPRPVATPVRALRQVFSGGEMRRLDAELDRAGRAIDIELAEGCVEHVNAAASAGARVVAVTVLPHAAVLTLSDRSQLVAVTADSWLKTALVRLAARQELAVTGARLDGRQVSLLFTDRSSRHIELTPFAATAIPAATATK